MKIFLCLMVLAALVFAVPAEVNVSGKWTGTLNVKNENGEATDQPALLVLKQSGTEISGTGGPDENEQHAITKGSIAGDKLLLELEVGEGRTIKIELTLADEHLKGPFSMTRDGETRTGTLNLARAK